MPSRLIDQAVKFGLAGGLVTCLSFAAFHLLGHGLSMDPVIAAALAYAIATLAGYLIHSAWTFRVRMGRGALVRFFMVSLVGVAAAAAGEHALHGLLGISSFPAFVLTTGTVAVASFVVNRAWVFRAVKE